VVAARVDGCVGCQGLVDALVPVGQCQWRSTYHGGAAGGAD